MPSRLRTRSTGRRFAALRLGALVPLGALALLGACGDSGPPSCVTVDASCTPRYAPTFDNVYNNTLRESCGSDSVACHSAAGKRGGLSMASADVAYAQLTDAERVVAGDPACSEIVVRMHGRGESYLMPPGAPLADADRCAIERWIADGALRTPSAAVTTSSPAFSEGTP